MNEGRKGEKVRIDRKEKAMNGWKETDGARSGKWRETGQRKWDEFEKFKIMNQRQRDRVHLISEKQRENEQKRGSAAQWMRDSIR